MKNKYPPRLSVSELREELDAYLHYRRTGGPDLKVGEPTIAADRTHIGQFLDWLETGRPGRQDYAETAQRLMPRVRPESQ